MSRRQWRLGAAASLVLSVACHAPVAPRPPPPAPPVQPAPPHVLDALAAGDRAWLYADGRGLRQAMLPDLLQAASALRADIQVGLATTAAQCGFQPLLAVDELLVEVEWSGDRQHSWAAVLRLGEPLERDLQCLHVIAPEARETSLEGRRAWQLREALLVWNDGLFVVASSTTAAQSMLARLSRPDPSAAPAKAAITGALLVANLAPPNPFDVDALGARWVAGSSGSRLDVRARFARDTSAKETESIVRDGLLQVLGSNASFDPGAEGVAERFVHGATVKRDGGTLDVSFDMPPLAGQTALVSRLTAIAVRGVRQHMAWDLSGEARDGVYAIARALVDYVGRTRAPGHRARFPPSAPLVPDDIPYGKRVVPNAHAFLHPSWQDIGYSDDRPTFYAYDFVTAKDGRSVVVRARGDIDGDGTTSLFELDVRLDAHDVPVIAPAMRERDADE